MVPVWIRGVLDRLPITLSGERLESDVRVIDDSGVARGIKQVGGKLRVSDTPYPWDIAIGNIPWAQPLMRFGMNLDVGTTQGLVSDLGGEYTYLTSAEQLKISSSDAADAGSVVSSGTATGGSATMLIDTGATFVSDGVAEGDMVVNDSDGAVGAVTSVDSETQLAIYRFAYGDRNAVQAGDAYRVVTPASTGAALVCICGLNGSYDEQHEFVVMNGMTQVTTTKSFLRVFEMRVHLAGTGLFNEGDITVTNNAATNNLARILAENNATLMGQWTVPRGHSMYLVAMDVSASSNKGSQVKLFVRPVGETFQLRYVVNVFASIAQIRFLLPLILEEKTDVEVRAKANVAGDQLAIAFHGWYEEQ